MCNLSKREKEVLELCLLCADDTVVAVRLGISPKTVANLKTRVRRKVAKAKKFLESVKKYRRVLYPERKYKL